MGHFGVYFYRVKNCVKFAGLSDDDNSAFTTEWELKVARKKVSSPPSLSVPRVTFQGPGCLARCVSHVTF